MTAICSCWFRGGSRPAEALARAVLPAPGGPVRSILCLPAIAMARARLTRGWPWMPLRASSGLVGALSGPRGDFLAGDVAGAIWIWLFKCEKSSDRVLTP